MSYDTYKLLHLLGLILLFTGFGAALLGHRKENGRPPRASAALHGAGLLIMLIAGFGMLPQLEIHWPWPGWVFAKAAVWLALGALPVLVKRGVCGRAMGWILAVVLGITAAALALYKPF